MLNDAFIVSAMYIIIRYLDVVQYTFYADLCVEILQAHNAL